MSNNQQNIPVNGDVKKNKKTESSWAFKINLGALECDGSAPCEKWTVEIPLLRNYVQPDSTNLDKVVSRIENFVLENHLPFGKKDKKGSGSYTRTSGAIFVESFPKLPVDSQEMEAIIVAGMGYWWWDDSSEMSVKNRTGLLTKETLLELDVMLGHLWSGSYPNVTDIPVRIPEVNVFLFCMHRTWTLLKDLPNFNENIKPLILRDKQWLKVSTLMLQENYSSNISLESYRFLRSFDIGFISLLELGLVASRIEVRPAVRENYLYDLILSLMSMVVGFTNDIASFARDISRGNNLNYVTLLSKEDGLSLKEAVHKTIDTIRNQTNDIDLACKQLCEEFGNESHVKQLVEAMKNAHNGCLTYYAHTARYGKNICSKPYYNY